MHLLTSRASVFFPRAECGNVVCREVAPDTVGSGSPVSASQQTTTDYRAILIAGICTTFELLSEPTMRAYSASPCSLTWSISPPMLIVNP